MTEIVSHLVIILLTTLLINIIVLVLFNLDKFELEFNSTEKERIFHCSSPVELHKQRAKLTVSIEKPIVSPPAFQLQIEQVNSTTIRVHVIPNGYIGVNRIRCHWDDTLLYHHAVDLIIGGREKKFFFF